MLLIWGCSGGSGDTVMPTVPIETERPASTGDYGAHCTWGMYQFVVDLDTQTLDAVPIRVGNMHLNALAFVEPPPLVFLTLETLQFNGDIIEADIGLRHPFLGLTQFTGFDVAGILISNGTITGFTDPDIVMAGNPEDTYLMNPDGYSSWWNPTLFPPNPDAVIFGYIDGMLGTPDDIGNYNSTVCGYKYFADGLEPLDSLDSLDLENRGMFSAGQKNVRHYTIHIGDDGLIFNYAVDACWQFPQGSPPWDAPDSFSYSANRPEAFHISVTETDNDLYYIDPETKGGTLGLDILVYDWQGPSTIAFVGIESPDGSIPYTEEIAPVDTSEFTGTYHFELSGDNLITTAPLDFFITVKDTETIPELGNIPAFHTCGGFEVGGDDPVEYEDILFYCADFGVGRNIFSIDPEGLTSPVQWTEQTDTSTWCEGPMVSPDGNYVLYLRYSWSNFGSELRRIDLETEEDISLSDTGMTNWYVYGSWRHDSQKIVYSYGSSIFASDAELYIMDPDGSNKTALEPTALYPWAPEYSPNDQTLVFQSFNDSQLYFYDLATDDVTQYTSNGTWNDDPTYSPDGQYIAWSTMSGMSTGRHIYISPLSSWTPPTWEIGFETYIRSPGFSPDGTKVVFDHGGFSGSELAVYTISDSTWYNVTANAFGDYMGDWGSIPVSD
jgi:Tol biopolymer transport system component